MATVIKIVYNVTNPIIKVTYDVTNVTIGGQDIAPVYINMDYSSSSAVTVITSVGLTMPSAFTVTNSPLTSSGTINVTGAGTTLQYVRGDGSLATFPTITNGTVTSVNLTAGTGISVSGGPITTSGSINVVNTAPDQVVSLTGSGTTTITGTYPNFTITSNDSRVGTVTSVDMTVPTGLTISGNPITSAGTLAVALASGYSIPTTANQANWTTAYNDSITSASVSGTTTKTLTLNQQDGGTIQASWSDIDTGLTSVGLSMPSAFAVSNSPLTSNGTIAVTGAGNATQYIRGDGQLATLPTGGSGGGASVSYYLNGSVNQGTIGGVTYYEMNRTPILGAGTDFTRNTNGYIASFLTDANDPALLSIPAGNYNFETYFEASSGGGNPTFYIELYKYDGTTFTLIASNSGSPKLINDGTNIEAYFSALAVPQTTLTLTDRLAIRIYVNTSGRTITLHTENNTLCQVITTFTTGLNALNGLTAQVQFLATGTSGTDFNINSVSSTHTFNLPTASATNRGALSSADWTTFNGKENVLTFSSPLSRSVNTVSIPAANSSQPGYLTSTDWSTFNGKQNALNGTGFVKISGTTISYDNSTYYLASNPNAYIPLTALSAGAGISYNNTTGVISSTITQYTNADARLAISESVTGLDYDNTTGVFTLTSGYVIPTTTSATNWDAAYNDKINSAAVTGTTTKTLTLTQQDGGTITASWTDINTDAVTSVFGRTGAIVAVSGDYTTTLVTEGTNLYYTDVRVSANSDVAANTAARHNAVTLGTANGLSLSTQQLSLALASTFSTGALSSTDWSTFNLKQNAITLTTTGSSGSATFIGDTLNIPSYSVSGLGAVPDSRTITINGEVYDLSANRTFEVGDYGTF